MRIASTLLLLTFVVHLGAGLPANRLHAAERPNIIYVLADDLGFGDLGCFGQRELKTPALDRMAAEGMSFTRHFAGSTVCAPSRCVLLTGLHTGHCAVRGNGPARLTSKDVCFPKLLQRSGYKTGAFGKWGIGNPPPRNDPNRHGFDEFYGYVNMFHAHNYFPEFLIRNGEKEPLRNVLNDEWKAKTIEAAREGIGVAATAVDYAPKMIADEALKFVRDHHKQPFFLYWALNIPHANNEGGRSKPLANNGMRVPDLGKFADSPWPIQERGFARMIQQIDDDMGRLFALLQELKIDQNTIVMFSSDNGPHQEGGHQVETFDSNGALRGWKRDLYDGGVRVPFLVRWPGQVPQDSTCRLLCGFQDVFPTMLELAGVKTEASTDGKSLVPILTKNSTTPIHDWLYWEFLEKGGRRAVFDGRWKLVQLNTLKPQQSATELYDLETDPAEMHNVAKRFPARVAKMTEWIEQAHAAPHE